MFAGTSIILLLLLLLCRIITMTIFKSHLFLLNLSVSATLAALYFFLYQSIFAYFTLHLCIQVSIDTRFKYDVQMYCATLLHVQVLSSTEKQNLFHL